MLYLCHSTAKANECDILNPVQWDKNTKYTDMKLSFLQLNTSYSNLQIVLCDISGSYGLDNEDCSLLDNDTM
jgi:hypothetical protein